MALDGIVLRAVVHELQKCVGGRINKIYQPNEHDIVLHIRAQGTNVKPLLSANPTYPRFHLTNETFINPPEAPMFCMLMRKHCESGIIEGIEQIGMERMIRLHVKQRDELGDVSIKTIVVEMMGRHSNVILMDPNTGNILDGIHHVTPAISTYRIVMPGCAYTLPPEQHKEHPLEVNRERFMELMPLPLECNEAVNAIVSSFNGISPLNAKEMVFRAAGESERVTGQMLWESFAAVMNNVRLQEYRPQIVTDERKGKSFFSVIELTHLSGEHEGFTAVSECLERYFSDKAERDLVKQRVMDLLRFVQNEKQKNIKKLDKLMETMEDAKDADKYRIVGELLNTFLHEIKKGDKQVEVLNYYDEEQRMVTISLDPLLTPSENAQRYFKKYTKAKTSLIAVAQQIEQTEQEIQYFEQLLTQLATASLYDIEEIREELVQGGYLRDRARKGFKKKKSDKPTLSCYTSSEGIPIYVGKNNLQNEYVTNKLAHSTDTWLHTKDIPGSHVVIRASEFGEDTLLEAAQLAAYYSQARESSQVPVDYTLIRHVRKPNGSKPGFVIYDHQKTLFVTPDEQLIKSMKVQIKN